MRAEPMKLLGLNLAIPFCRPIRLSLFRLSFHLPALPTFGSDAPLRDALGVQGGAAPSFRADSVAAS
jgi:hypothetical protein